MNPAYADECEQLLRSDDTHEIWPYPLDDDELRLQDSSIWREPAITRARSIRGKISDWYFYTDSGAYARGVFIALGLLVAAGLVIYGLDRVFHWGYVDMIWDGLFPTPVQPEPCPLLAPDRDLCGSLGYAP